jgi:TetR/AcrR family transcriptional regulator, tetracycline repressor protein
MDQRSSQTKFDTGTVFKRAGSRPAEEAEAEMAAKREGITANDANPGPPRAEPQIAPPPWQRLPDRPARRRREPISREAIVTAAIRLLDREGLAALSMRRLAEELGTGAASLYWHVGSKDGLLDLVFDELIGEEQVPDADPSRWQEQLKDAARAQRRLSLRHPYLVRISIGRIPMGPNALRFSERMLAILRAGGLPPRLAVQGYLLLIATVNGFTVDETGVEDSGAENSGRGARPADPAELQEVANMARDYIASLPAEQFPNMVGLADEFAFAGADERFEMLIDIFVDGLARRAAVSG